MTLGCELRRRGIGIRLIEKADEFPVTSRAMGIQARTMEVFDNMGIASQILAQGRTVLGVTIAKGDRVLFTAKQQGPPSAHPDEPYRGAVVQNQATTEGILRARLEALGGAVERSSELTEFHEVGDCVEATVVHTRTGATERIRAAFLAGCDGAHSTVRQQLDLNLEGVTYEEHLVLGDLQLDTDMPHDTVILWLNSEGMLGAIPFRDPHLWRLIAVVTPDATGAVPQASLELFQRLLAERASDTKTRVSNPVWLSNFQVHRRMVYHYRRGRVFVAGDAAHIHSPAGGQGMNTGIQDAFNLAWKLALAVRGRADSSLLDTYEEERRPVAQRVLKETDANQKMMLSTNLLFQFLREHVLIPVLKVPGVMDFLLHRGSELDVNYRGASLAQDYPEGLGHALRAGDRAPDAPVRATATGEPTTLFAQFRTPRFTLLLFDDPARPAAALQPLAELGRNVPSRFAEDMQTRLVVSAKNLSELGDGTRDALLDAEGQARKIYDARGESLYLIRPDGYIGFRSQPAAETPVLRYLEKIFPAASSKRSLEAIV